MGALGLFLLERDLLLFELLGALPLETGVVADVELGATLVQVQRVRTDAIEELAVVRDHHQHAGIFQQPLFQPQHGKSLGIINACARFSRARQPPEKSDTGNSCISGVNPRPCKSRPARAVAS